MAEITAEQLAVIAAAEARVAEIAASPNPGPVMVPGPYLGGATTAAEADMVAAVRINLGWTPVNPPDGEPLRNVPGWTEPE